MPRYCREVDGTTFGPPVASDRRGICSLFQLAKALAVQSQLAVNLFEAVKNPQQRSGERIEGTAIGRIEGLDLLMLGIDNCTAPGA